MIKYMVGNQITGRHNVFTGVIFINCSWEHSKHITKPPQVSFLHWGTLGTCPHHPTKNSFHKEMLSYRWDDMNFVVPLCVFSPKIAHVEDGLKQFLHVLMSPPLFTTRWRPWQVLYFARVCITSILNSFIEFLHC